LGPIFRLVLELQNTSPDSPSMNLFLTFQCDVRIYKIERSIIRAPFLAPGILYNFGTKVECVSKLNISDIIKVSLQTIKFKSIFRNYFSIKSGLCFTRRRDDTSDNSDY
jgi:hypothetical protein